MDRSGRVALYGATRLSSGFDQRMKAIFTFGARPRRKRAKDASSAPALASEAATRPAVDPKLRRAPRVRLKDVFRIAVALALTALIFLGVRWLIGIPAIAAIVALVFAVWAARQRPFARLRRNLFGRRREVWVDENGVGFNESYYQD